MAYSYTVSYSTSSTGPWTLAASNVTALSDTITNLASQTQYYVQLITVDTTTGLQSNPVVAGPYQTAASTTVLRNWYESPGQNGSFWVQPFYHGANFITSGPLVTSLRNGTHSSPTGIINLAGNYSVPWYIGRATDPLVLVTDGTKSFHVRIPVGAVVEGPASQFDQSIGGADVTQPYLVWSISGASINTGSIRDSTSVITGTYALAIQDGAGLMMVDAVTGALGVNNSIGNLQDYELTKAIADPTYLPQHMLAFQMDPTQAAPGPTLASLAWPLRQGDGGATYTGSIPQGITIGIDSSVARPTGKTRGFYLLFDNLQQFGWFNYNFGNAGCTFITCYSTLSSNAGLVSDLQNSISSVMAYASILNYNSGVSGAQYSLATTKGFTPGATAAFPNPPLLDLSPTNHQNVAPSSFGAWYPNTSYTATPTNAIT